MKRITKILSTTFVALLLLTIGCKGPKAIPDKDLVNIFHDAFLANAYYNEKLGAEDSLLLYEPILARYGYSVEDMQFTVQTIAQRKSSRLSDLVGEASSRLEMESKEHNYQLVVLDTIDNVAKRRYTRIMHSDSLIKATKLKDSSKLHIVLRDIVPGEYSVTFDYLIDTTDKNRNSRVEAYMQLRDSGQSMRHTMMLSRYREAKYQRKFTADTVHKELHINIFYHPNNETPEKPGITIRNFKITRIIPVDQAVDSLLYEQMVPMLFNHSFMKPQQPQQPKGKAQRVDSSQNSEAKSTPAQKAQPKSKERTEPQKSK